MIYYKLYYYSLHKKLIIICGNFENNIEEYYKIANECVNLYIRHFEQLDVQHFILLQLIAIRLVDIVLLIS